MFKTDHLKIPLKHCFYINNTQLLLNQFLLVDCTITVRSLKLLIIM